MRYKSNAEPIITKILNQIHGRLPLIGVGSIYTADDAIKALDTGVEFLSLGREIIMEPDWMTKVEMGKSSEIRTNLKKSDRELLKIPEPLWNTIMNTQGWFPIVE